MVRPALFCSVPAAIVAVLLISAPLASPSDTVSVVPLPVSEGAVVVPLTASSCNGNTCQWVYGSGTTVTDWYTQTTAPSAVCTYAEFLENGVIIAESGGTCLSAGGEAAANWTNPGSFPVGTKLCTTWAGIAGKPCATIG
jgi:hypothetical protein